MPTLRDAYIGSRLRLARMEVGISQERLGQTLGVSFQQIQKYEAGKNRLSAVRLFEIATLFQKPVGFFFEDIASVPDEVVRFCEHVPAHKSLYESIDRAVAAPKRLQLMKILRLDELSESARS